MPAAAAKTPPVRPKKAPARKRAARRGGNAKLVDALAEAAWHDADRALAQALAEFDALNIAKSKAAREDAMLLLGQALSRAMRKRGLARYGAIGARETYDPKRHDLSRRTARAPKAVRIGAQGFARGGEILVKARVTAIPAKKRTS